jgi:chaperonin GroEL
MQAKIAEI